MPTSAPPAPTSVGRIFFEFFRLGCLSFGGPLAALSLMQEELSRKMQWIDEDTFLKYLAMAKLMPGPVSTHMALMIGSYRAKRWGGFFAGVGFILPSFILMLIISYLYFERGMAKLPNYVELSEGLQIGALCVIFTACFKMAKPIYRLNPFFPLFLFGLCSSFFLPKGEIFVILGAGVLGVLSERMRPTFRCFDLGALFWLCFVSGAFVFGTGLAIVPLLQSEVVDVRQWMTAGEFLDGVAFGQLTPGPVVITATFIGYKVAGLLGAITATLGIFLASFVNILFFFPRYFHRLSRAKSFTAFVRFVIPTVIGCIAGIALRMSKGVLIDYSSIFTFLVLLGLLISERLPPWFVILLGPALVLSFSALASFV